MKAAGRIKREEPNLLTNSGTMMKHTVNKIVVTLAESLTDVNLEICGVLLIKAR